VDVDLGQVGGRRIERVLDRGGEPVHLPDGQAGVEDAVHGHEQASVRHPDADLEDGVIEVDVAMARQRSYPAILFSLHRAGFYPDALQYAPVFNGVGGWQLYSGPGYTAGATLPENEWVQLRLEVQGPQARLFVGPDPEPALLVDHLEWGDSKGGVGLRSRGPASSTTSRSTRRARST
jgi:hypothetical protein